jgi:hypothetical protein
MTNPQTGTSSASRTSSMPSGMNPATPAPRHRARRLSTETKSAFKTTELIMYVLAVAGVLIASQLVDSESPGGDYFKADRAWLYIVILTVGYLLSRGFAKSGSRDFFDDEDR